MNYNGYINLFQLSGVQFLNVNGKPSIVIPTGMNDIKVQKNEKTGALSATLGIKAESVGDRYREVERQNHQGEQGWDESKLTSHQLIRSWSKEMREKLFARLKEQIQKENDYAQLMEKMDKVLRKDGSEGVASVENERAWEKLLWQELDKRSRVGRLSQNINRSVEVNSASVNVAAQEADFTTPQYTEEELPF